MRRLYGALVVLFICAVVVITGYSINTGVAGYVFDSITKAEHLCRSGDRDRTKKAVYDAEKCWSENLDIMLLFVSHGKADEIESTLSTAKSFFDSGSTDMFLASCKEAQIELKHFIEAEKTGLYNIL